jgi:hypothetical protein
MSYNLIVEDEGATYNLVIGDMTPEMQDLYSATVAAKNAAEGFAEVSEDKAGEASISAQNAHNSEVITEGYKNSSETFKNSAESFAQSSSQSATLAEGYKNSAESASNSALSYKNSAENAKNSAELIENNVISIEQNIVSLQSTVQGYASTAENNKNLAETAANTATTKAGEASDSAILAGTYLSSVEADALEAEHWANYTVDIPVPEGDGLEYSAKHHATKASISETNSYNSSVVSGTAAGNSIAASLVAQQASDNAIAVVTGGTASLISSPGKIPLADSTGKIDPSWVDPISAVSVQALHRSPNEVTSIAIYDTSLDSDNGAWTERCQNTSWYNESLNGKWLGAHPSESSARAVTSATTNDYFQLSSDGKFYKLNSTSGTIEVFRGNKATFPKLSAIVGETSGSVSYVTIYDLTEPGRPMWKRLVNTGAIPWGTFSAAYPKQISFLNARLWIGGSLGLAEINWAEDSILWRNSSTVQLQYGISIVSTDKRISTSGTPLTHNPIYATSPCILNDGAIDTNGLRIPSVAVASSFVQIFWPDRTRWYFSVAFISMGVTLTKDAIWFPNRTDASSLYFGNNPLSLRGTAASSLTQVTSTLAPQIAITGALQNLISLGNFQYARTGANLLLLSYNNSSSIGKGLGARVTNTYNTGWMFGDIRRSYLSDITSGNITGTINDRSYKGASASVTGTLTSASVTPSSQLVAFSEWSNNNYIRETYSADLDFGTGEWNVGAWVNVPVTLPDYSMLPLYGELLTNGSFDTDSAWTKLNAIISGGQATLTANGSSVSQNILPTTVGRVFKFTIVISSGSNAIAYCGTTTSGDARYAKTGLGVGTHTFYLQSAGINSSCRIGATASGTVVVDSVSVQEVVPFSIIDRTHSSGPKVLLGLTVTGYFIATAYDGTTMRTVSTSSSYNNNSWVKVETIYTTDGTLSIRINGLEVATTRGNPLLTLNNSLATLTIGNSYTLDAPFPGSITMVKFSGNAPTLGQSIWMYLQEKQMFLPGAQVTLPSAETINDITYDGFNNNLQVLSNTYDSTFNGLIRTSSITVPAGTYAKGNVKSFIEATSRITSNPGVDISIPSIGLKRLPSEKNLKQTYVNSQLSVFEWVGGFTANLTNGNTAITSITGLSIPAQTTVRGARISGTGITTNTTLNDVASTTGYISSVASATNNSVQVSFLDFILPQGYEAIAVMVAGVRKQEGSSKDWVRLFDGFNETIRFSVAPGYQAWVQIQAQMVV